MTQTHVTTQLAAAAPLEQDEDGGDAAMLHDRADVEQLCWAWSEWCRTRNLYVRPSLPVSVLGRLREKGTGRSASGGPDGPASAELAAFHIAFLAQPEDALDRRVFELHYYRRVRNVKSVAASVGVSRQHWYRLAGACRDRIYQASRQILERNLAAARALPHFVE